MNRNVSSKEEKKAKILVKMNDTYDITIEILYFIQIIQIKMLIY